MAKKLRLKPNDPRVAGQVIKGMKDVISQPLYDTLQIDDAFQGNKVFFATPVGQPAAAPKTLADTNLRSAGEIERGKLFFMYGMSVDFNDSQIVGADYDNLITTGRAFLQFQLLDKIYWESPFKFIPAMTGYYNIDNLTTVDTITPFNQVTYLGLSKPIKIWGKQSFSLTLQIPNAITLTKSYRLTFYLHGTLARNIQ